MGSTDGRPVLGRRTTFQRMLDAEKKTKLHRMQASPTNMPLVRATSTARKQNAISSLDYRPPTLPITARAMTSPALSITIPPANPTSNGVTKKYIIRSGGEVVLHEDGASDQETDASSICHSPGWDDLSGKKRKKEKREAKERKRKEKEKPGAASKKDIKTKHRLSKPPPNSNSRYINRIPNEDRSISEPVVPILQNGADSNSKPKPAEEGRRSRRGSFDLGIKTLKNVAAVIPSAWRSSSTPRTPIAAPVDIAPVHDKPPSRGSFSHQKTPSRSSIDNNGFIGGLKLRQAEEANIQETIRQVQPVKTNNTQSQPVDDQDPVPQTTGTSGSGSFVESIRPTSIYEESARSPDHWDKIFASAINKTTSSPSSIHDIEPDVPIMERNIRKSRKSHPPTSRYFPLDTDDSMNTTRDTSVASTRTSIASSPFGKEERSEQRHSTVSSERPPISVPYQSSERPDSIELLRGRQNAKHIQNQRQDSIDQSISGPRNESETSGPNKTRKQSRGRKLSFGRSTNRDGTGSRDATLRPTTRDSSTSREIDQELDVMESTRVKAFIAPQTHQEQLTPPRVEGKAGNHHRKSSSRTSFKGFRTAAKNAFSRSSVAAESTGGSAASPAQTPNFNRPQLTRRAVTTDSVSTPASTINNAERDVVPPTVIKDYAQRPYSSGIPLDSPDSLRHPNASGAVFHGTNGRNFHMRTATDSSEEYSTLDEFSNVTTPTASRPNSQKNYKPASDEPSPEVPQIDLTWRNSIKSESLDSPPLMTGAIPFNDAASRRDSWCRTAQEFELTEDEDRLKTPTGKKQPVTNFSAPFRDPSPPTMPTVPRKKSLELEQKLGIQHSVSTPNIQDLSFLPALKHQALGRSEKEPEKAKQKEDPALPLENKGKRSSSKGREPAADQKSLARPSAKPITTIDTKSEGDISSGPSQYLQHARLSMLRPKPHSPTSSFPPNPNISQGQGGQEPLAKMFVICCSCKYFHDMPSKIYECMAKPDNVVTDTNLGVSGVISTSVKCPWCGHGMTTSCCAGYAAVVYLREKFH